MVKASTPITPSQPAAHTAAPAATTLTPGTSSVAAPHSHHHKSETPRGPPAVPSSQPPRTPTSTNKNTPHHYLNQANQSRNAANAAASGGRGGNSGGPPATPLTPVVPAVPPPTPATSVKEFHDASTHTPIATTKISTAIFSHTKTNTIVEKETLIIEEPIKPAQSTPAPSASTAEVKHPNHTQHSQQPGQVPHHPQQTQQQLPHSIPLPQTPHTPQTPSHPGEDTPNTMKAKSLNPGAQEYRPVVHTGYSIQPPMEATQAMRQPHPLPPQQPQRMIQTIPSWDGSTGGGYPPYDLAAYAPVVPTYSNDGIQVPYPQPGLIYATHPQQAYQIYDPNLIYMHAPPPPHQPTGLWYPPAEQEQVDYPPAHVHHHVSAQIPPIPPHHIAGGAGIVYETEVPSIPAVLHKSNSNEEQQPAVVNPTLEESNNLES